MEALSAVLANFAPLSQLALARLLEITSFREFPAKSRFVRMGRKEESEYVVLRGLVRLFTEADDRREVTLSFHPEGTVLTPLLARNRGGISSVSCQSLEPTFLAIFQGPGFAQLIRSDEEIRKFANRVLEDELIRKTRKEISLATLPAKERLLELRRNLPQLENRVSHGHIASYLGISAISLSRLRNELTRRD